jgi:lipid II:glycine glycyltransferase (peptidoglycan interpeptide bridge formation enzyme)
MKSDLRQSDEWGKFLSTQGWEIEAIRDRRSVTRAYIKKIPLIGSVVKIQRPPAMPPIKEIDKIAQKHRALFVKLEPSLSTINGFLPDPAPCLPTKTVVIDLTKSEKELRQDFSQDARQSINKAEREQLSVTSYQGGNESLGKGLIEFHQLLKKAGRRTHFWPPNFKTLKAKTDAFGKNAILFLAHPPTHRASEGQAFHPLAGALILIHNGTAYYHHAASTSKGQKLHAPYLLIWEAIKFLKDSTNHQLSTIDYLDFEGIYDPRYHRATRNWQKFSIFKTKFGGTEIDYPPPLIKGYNPIARFLLKLGHA